MITTCNTCETHVIIRVPTAIKTWEHAVRRVNLTVLHRQSTVFGRVLRVGITENIVCLAAYHWQMDFAPYWTWLAVLRQFFSSGTAADGHTPYKARPSQNWPKFETDDHVHQIFITSCAWLRRGVLCDRGFTEKWTNRALVTPPQSSPNVDIVVLPWTQILKQCCFKTAQVVNFYTTGEIIFFAYWPESDLTNITMFY